MRHRGAAWVAALRHRLLTPVLPVAVLPLLVLPLLAACGFQPVYAPATQSQVAAEASGHSVAGELAAIDVGLIGERSGQLLRNALQERFERSGITAARHYDLSVSYSVSSEGIGIRQDYSSTRQRYIGRATYTLTADSPVRHTLTSGIARAVDGLNVFNQQYFASDQESDAVIRRIAGAVADQIAQQLAVYFHKRAAASAG